MNTKNEISITIRGFDNNLFDEIPASYPILLYGKKGENYRGHKNTPLSKNFIYNSLEFNHPSDVSEYIKRIIDAWGGAKEINKIIDNFGAESAYINIFSTSGSEKAVFKFSRQIIEDIARAGLDLLLEIKNLDD